LNYNTTNTLKIALDGPSGAGKSTLAKAISSELKITYIDTGALYRSIGLFVKRAGKNPKSADEVGALLPEIRLNLEFGDDGGQRVILCGEDVSGDIRTPEMSMYASAVSALPCVREFLLSTQRSIAESSDVILDGRDIGTVIIPDADVKIFLTASSEARARRRCDELTAKGASVSYEDVLADMIKRDKDDSERDIAPAVAAPDAIILDNSGISFDETVAAALTIIGANTDKMKKS
jgi:cytidylate kinase